MNYELLRKIMREKGITVTRMCNEIGISRKAFWSKCTGKTEFKQSEIAKVINLIGAKHGSSVFFPKSVRNDTIEEKEA